MDKKFLNNCQDIFDAFDILAWNDTEEYDYGHHALRMLIESIVNENRRREKIFHSSKPSNEDEDLDLGDDLIIASFGIGYLVGQAYDISDHKKLKSIEELKKALRKKPFLPFFPHCPPGENETPSKGV